MVRERDSNNSIFGQDCPPSTEGSESPIFSYSSSEDSDDDFLPLGPPAPRPKYGVSYFAQLGIEVEGLEDDYW